MAVLAKWFSGYSARWIMEKGEAGGDTLQEHEIKFTRRRSRVQIVFLVALLAVVILLMALAIGVAAGLGVAHSTEDEGEQVFATDEDVSLCVQTSFVQCVILPPNSRHNTGCVA